MRGIVASAIMLAALVVIDAAFFKGKHLKDGETALLGLTGLSSQIGKR